MLAQKDQDVQGIHTELYLKRYITATLSILLGVRTMRTRAFWTLYVGITILIVLIQVEGRPGKSPAGKTVGK